jgi:chromate transporter
MREDRAAARAIVRYLLRLGAVGFGGPIALVGYMQRDLVERDGLVTRTEFRDGMALAQLAPGPLAAQVAIYLGWVRGGTSGATLAGAAFILPSFAMVLALSAAYVQYGGLPWMSGAFVGVGAAVIAIIARSAWRLTRVTLGRDRLLWAAALACAVATAWLGREPVLLIVACGIVTAVWRVGLAGVLAGSRHAALVLAWPTIGVALDPAPVLGGGSLVAILGYFTGAGLFVFGSGLAIVPFLHGGVVQEFGWLTERQFLDAIAVSMITPGPVVITVAFIGFLVAGVPGALMAAAGVFLPVWIVTVLAAPHFHRVTAWPSIRAFVDGVTAAATGAIAGATIVLGQRALSGPFTWVVLGLSLVVLAMPRRTPEVILIAAAALAGVRFG